MVPPGDITVTLQSIGLKLIPILGRTGDLPSSHMLSWVGRQVEGAWAGRAQSLVRLESTSAGISFTSWRALKSKRPESKLWPRDANLMPFPPRERHGVLQRP